MAEYQIAFQQGGSPTDVLVASPYIANTVMLFSVKDAKQLIRDFKNAVQTTTWQEDRPEAVLDYTATALSFPKVGDATFATRLFVTAREKEFGFESEYQADYIVWRQGPVISFDYVVSADAAALVKSQASKVAEIFGPCPKKKKQD